MLYKVILKKQMLPVTEEDDDFHRLMSCAIGSSLQVCINTFFKLILKYFYNVFITFIIYISVETSK